MAIRPPINRKPASANDGFGRLWSLRELQIAQKTWRPIVQLFQLDMYIRTRGARVVETQRSACFPRSCFFYSLSVRLLGSSNGIRKRTIAMYEVEIVIGHTCELLAACTKSGYI
jgi:hypothetical protein